MPRNRKHITFRTATIAKFEAENRKFLKITGVSLEYRNVENMALYNQDVLEQALEGKPFSEWTRDISKGIRRKLFEGGLIQSGSKKVYFRVRAQAYKTLKPTILWVSLCYPDGPPEDRFPNWRDYIYDPLS